MAVEIHADRLNGPQTAKGRLYEWSRTRHYEEPNPWPASPFYKIHREQENAGAHGSGIKFDIIEVDGESIAVPPDGGMGEFCERHERRMHFHLRAREVASAVDMLPPDLRAVVIETYRVSQRERPKSERVVALAMGITRIEVIKRLERAYGWLSRDLGIPAI